jgi:hypothetical protein
VQTDSYRGIALSGPSTASPSIIRLGALFPLLLKLRVA